MTDYRYTIEDHAPTKPVPPIKIGKNDSLSIDAALKGAIPKRTKQLDGNDYPGDIVHYLSVEEKQCGENNVVYLSDDFEVKWTHGNIMRLKIKGSNEELNLRLSGIEYVVTSGKDYSFTDIQDRGCPAFNAKPDAGKAVQSPTN